MEENTYATDYATDGRCHNANDNAWRECSKPAAWLGTDRQRFTMGFCDRCRRDGDEARTVVTWTRIGRGPTGNQPILCV